MFETPIFVVADGDEPARPERAFRIRVNIGVRAIVHVVSLAFEPVGERKFPKEKFARTLRKGRVQNLAIFSVWAVVADADARLERPLALAVVIEREVVRPAVISLPGIVAALEEKIGRAVVADNENDVALLARVGILVGEQLELAEIDAA